MLTDPLAEPKRIAFAGDFHMNVRWARAAVKYAIECMADVVIHVGDFGYTFDPAFLRAVDQGVPVLFVDGNHDNHDWLAEQPIGKNGLRYLGSNVWHLPRGFRWTWAGVRFLACGGAYSVDRQWRALGESWWAGETITDDDVYRCADGGPTDVLVAHDCPTGVIIPEVDDRTTPAPFPAPALVEATHHRRKLRRIVDATAPHTIWHGHYHVRYEQQAQFPGRPATVVGLDCDGTTMDRNVQVVNLADLTGP